MADGRVEFAVSATPIFSHSAGEGSAADVIATDVGKSVGGGGSEAVTWATVTGYSGGSPSYITSNGGTIAMSAGRFLYIKNTGRKYSSSSTLGAVSGDYFTITVDGNSIVILGAGSAIVLPNNAALTQTFIMSQHSEAVAVEYFWTA